MGIFDVFKTKVGETTKKAGDVAGQAWDKAGDVAGQAKDKVSDMMDKKKGGAADDPSARPPAGPPASAETGMEGEASNMVSEGGPVAQAGEAAPGVGDDGSAMPGASGTSGASGASGGGMTQSIKDNVASGADKAGEMAQGASGNRFDEKIDSAVQQGKDRLG